MTKNDNCSTPRDIKDSPMTDALSILHMNIDAVYQALNSLDAKTNIFQRPVKEGASSEPAVETPTTSQAMQGILYASARLVDMKDYVYRMCDSIQG